VSVSLDVLLSGCQSDATGQPGLDGHPGRDGPEGQRCGNSVCGGGERCCHSGSRSSYCYDTTKREGSGDYNRVFNRDIY